MISRRRREENFGVSTKFWQDPPTSLLFFVEWRDPPLAPALTAEQGGTPLPLAPLAQGVG